MAQFAVLTYVKATMCTDMPQHQFFGYGSLVNRNTHAYAPARPALLQGWRRVWHRAPNRPVAFLSVVPDTACAIQGLVAAVPRGDFGALDLREASYDRLDVTTQVPGAAPQTRIAVYAVAPGTGHAPDADHPILQSYVDAVLQGFLREYGQAGVQGFLDTTDGWHAPIFNDRAAPRYPRAQVLTTQERALIDDTLADLRKAL